MSDFTTKDFTDTYKELLNSVKILTNKWDPSTSSEANVGVVLLKLMALIKDKLDYKQDLAESQAYLGEVSDRQNAFDLLQMLGYIMKEAKSASGYVEITNTSGENIVLPAFSPVSDSTGEILYFTTEGHSFGAITDAGSVEQSKKSVLVMEGTIFDIQKEGIDKYSIKDIDENGRFFLGKTGLASNGVFIGVIKDDGTVDYSSWKNIEAEVIYPQGNYFYILTAETGENYIQFPDNFSNLIGSQSFVVKATYTKGSAGNCKKGSLIKIPTNTSAFAVRQFSDIVSGENSETIRQAESNYYSTMGTFKTLVSSTDYSAAIRYILHGANVLVSGETDTSKVGLRRFSNCFVNSAIDRQKRVITRLDEKEYIYHCFDTDDSSTVLDVLTLKSSDSNSSEDFYRTEFEMFNMDDRSHASDKQDIISQLNDSRSFAIQLKAYNQYYLAKTLLKGTILANIDQSQQAQEILNKIVLSLKTTYKATNLTFGKKLDYYDLIDTIKNSDNRIISVILEQPKYQVYKRTLTGDVSLTNEEKEKIVARSVLQGQMPLFKFMNRPNSSSKSFSSGDYISIGLNASTFRGLAINGAGSSATTSSSVPTMISPIIKDINMNPGLLTSEGILNLSSNKIAIQFNKKLYVTEVEYSYGTRYALLSTSKHVLSSDLSITSTSSILAGSKIASGSTLICDVFSGGLSEYEPDEDGAIELTADYFVIKEVQLKEGSILKKDSILTKGSIYNNFEVTGQSILPDRMYELGTGETLLVSANNNQKEYGQGTKVIVSGFTMTSRSSIGGIPDGQILNNTQSIKILTEDVSEISKDFLYFIKTRNNNPITLSTTSSYQLDEDEYFVYSDKALTEYIILGPGTILSVKESGGTLNNVYTGDDVNNASTGAFGPIPIEIIATSTETSTFLDGYSIEFDSDADRTNLGITYRQLSNNATVNNTKNTNEAPAIFTATDGYSVRLIPILYTNALGICEIPYPVELKIADSINNVNLLEIKNIGTASNDTLLHTANKYSIYLHSSELFYLAATSRNLPLFSGEKTGKLCAYSEGARQGKDSQIDYPSPFEVEINGTASDSYTTINIALLPNVRYLVFNVDKVPGSQLEIQYGPGGQLDADGMTTAKLMDDWTTPVNYESNNVTSARNLTVIVDTNGLSSSRTNSLVIKTGVQSVKLWNVSYVSDFSDEIKHIYSENGSPLSNTSLDYYNSSNISTSNTLIASIIGTDKKVNGKDTDADGNFLFNWLCTPSDTVAHPTDSNEFFVDDHVCNKETLPFIDFDGMLSQQTLKVLPVTGRFKS